MRVWTVALPVIVATVAQAFARYGFGPRKPIGDEAEYIERVRSTEVLGPNPFLRVPAMELFARLAGKRQTEERLRDLTALLSLATAACVALASYFAMGWPGAITAALMFVLWPDRIVLSQHIWPDALLALSQSLLLVMVAYSLRADPVSPWLVGAVVAAAVMTRIDSIVLLPALTIVAAVIYERLLPTLPGLWLPSLALLALYTLRNGHRYGLWLPDTTILFNVSILAEEQRRSASAAGPVESLVQAVLPQWHRGSHQDRVSVFQADIGTVLRQPGRLLRGIVSRVWQMLGPDAFAIEILLHPERGAYPLLPDWLRRTFIRLLGVGFPILCALAIAGASVDADVRVCLVPACAAFLAACVGHARTRFRYATLPALSLAAAAGLLAMADPQRGWIAGVVALLSGAVLLCAPQRREMSPSGIPTRMSSS